jgi:hypothetical protein
MSRADRNHLDNIFCVGMKPPDTSMSDCLPIFVQDIKKLQHGFFLTIEGKLYFIVGGLGIVKADMPAAQALAGCLHQNAGEPCRMCRVTKGTDLGDPAFDARMHTRTVWQADAVRAACLAGEKDAHADTGLSVLPSALEDRTLVFDRFAQIPPEPLHAELLGISLLALSLLMNMLTHKWLGFLSKNLQRIKTPWPELPALKLSKRQRAKLNAEQVCRVLQLLPFVLTSPRASDGRVEDWLKPTFFTKKALVDLEARVGRTSFIPLLRQAFVALAQSNALVFAEERPAGAEFLEELQTAVNATRTTMRHVFGSTFDRPNAHTTAAHVADSADRFGVPKNWDVRTLETKHAPFKRFISNTNNQVVERQMMMWANIKQAAVYLARGGKPTNDLITDQVWEHMQSDPVFAQLLDRTTTTDPHGSAETADLSDAVTVVGEQQSQGYNEWKLKWGKKDKRSTPLSAHDRKQLCAAADADSDIRYFQGVTTVNGSHHSAKVSVNDAWEVSLSAAQGPKGPRAGIGIAQVQHVMSYHGQAFVNVRWLGKATAQPQQLTGCHAYQLKVSDKYTTILPINMLHRRTHLVQHGLSLLLNKYFIK